MFKRMNRRVTAGLMAFAVVLSNSVMPAMPAFADVQPVKKVDICHRTDAYTNPYVSENIAVEAALNRAENSVNGAIGVYPTAGWGDIIPPFAYEVNGKETVIEQFPGLNWTAAGQAIYNNGCTPVVPEVDEPFPPKPKQIVVAEPATTDPCGPNNIWWNVSSIEASDKYTWFIEKNGTVTFTTTSENYYFVVNGEATNTLSYELPADSNFPCEDTTQPFPPEFNAQWLDCRSFNFSWKNLAKGSTMRIIWKDADGKWLGYYDTKDTTKVWGKYDMPLATASVEYVVTNANGVQTANEVFQNTMPCAQSADWTGCDAFFVQTANYPANYTVTIRWNQNGQGQYTTVPVSVTNTTSWWSGDGRDSVESFSYTINDASGAVVFRSADIAKDVECTPEVPAPVAVPAPAMPRVIDECGPNNIKWDLDSIVESDAYEVVVEDDMVIFLANEGYYFDVVDDELIYYVAYELPADSDVACPVEPEAPVEPVTPDKGSTTLPVAVERTAFVMPTELPETGASPAGLIVALAAAVVTYGAVYFAGRREYQL